MATAVNSPLELPGPVPEILVGFLNPAERKLFRLTCKDARALIDRTVRSVTVDVSNVRVLCGPWRPLHTIFPHVRHLAVCLRSTGVITWDPATARAPGPLHHRPVTAPAASAETRAAGSRICGGGGGGGSGQRHAFSRCSASSTSGGPAAAAAGYSLRLLRDCVPRLHHLTSLDLTQCYLDPSVWCALCAAVAAALPPGLSLRLHPAAALPFPGRTWADRLGAMLQQLAAMRPDVRVCVAPCGAGEGGGSVSTGGAACWCDVDGDAGLDQVAQMSCIAELAMCVWSRSPSQPNCLERLSSLTALRRLRISCCHTRASGRSSTLDGLSALSHLRELSIGLTSSPLHLADLAPLAECTALTALSVGWITAGERDDGGQLGVGGGGGGGAGDGDGGGGDGSVASGGGGGGSGSVTPLPSVRRFEVRSCLSSGPLPLYDLVPAAVSVSMCALTMGGGGRLLMGHVLTSIRPPPPQPPPTATATMPPAPLLQLPSQRRCPPGAILQPPSPPPPPSGLTSLTAPPLPSLRRTLRSLELVQRDTVAYLLGPIGEGTGRAPLPGLEVLGELVALEQLQLTDWRLKGAQLPALLVAAQRLPRLRLMTLRDCGQQSFGWRTSPVVQLGRGLGTLDRLVGLQLRSLEHIQVLGAPDLRLLEQVALACRAPSLRRLELHGVSGWDPKVFHRILGTSNRHASTASANIVNANAGAGLAFADSSGDKPTTTGAGPGAGAPPGGASTPAAAGEPRLRSPKAASGHGCGSGGGNCAARMLAACTAAAAGTAAAVGGMPMPSICWLYGRRSAWSPVAKAPRALERAVASANQRTSTTAAEAPQFPFHGVADRAEACGANVTRTDGGSGSTPSAIAAAAVAAATEHVDMQLGQCASSGDFAKTTRTQLRALPATDRSAVALPDPGCGGRDANNNGSGGSSADEDDADGSDSGANGDDPPQCGCWGSARAMLGNGVTAGTSAGRGGFGGGFGGASPPAAAGRASATAAASPSGERAGTSARTSARVTGGGSGSGDNEGSGGGVGVGGRWPQLKELVVHGCPGTSFEVVRRHVAAAGLGAGVQVEWMANTQSLGRDQLFSDQETGVERWPGRCL